MGIYKEVVLGGSRRGHSCKEVHRMTSQNMECQFTDFSVTSVSMRDQRF